MEKRTDSISSKSIHSSSERVLGFFLKNPKKGIVIGCIVIAVCTTALCLTACVCMRDGTVNNSADLDAAVSLPQPESG